MMTVRSRYGVAMEVEGCNREGWWLGVNGEERKSKEKRKTGRGKKKKISGIVEVGQHCMVVVLKCEGGFYGGLMLVGGLMRQATER